MNLLNYNRIWKLIIIIFFNGLKELRNIIIRNLNFAYNVKYFKKRY